MNTKSERFRHVLSDLENKQLSAKKVLILVQ